MNADDLFAYTLSAETTGTDTFQDEISDWILTATETLSIEITPLT